MWSAAGRRWRCEDAEQCGVMAGARSATWLNGVGYAETERRGLVHTQLIDDSEASLEAKV